MVDLQPERDLINSRINSYTIPLHESELSRKQEKQIFASPGQVWMDDIHQSFDDKWLELHPEYKTAKSFTDCCGISKNMNSRDEVHVLLLKAYPNTLEGLSSNHGKGNVAAIRADKLEALIKKHADNREESELNETPTFKNSTKRNDKRV